MDITIYSTTTCGACKTLIGMLPKDADYTVINKDMVDQNTLPPQTGEPTVYIDGKMLRNAFELVDIIKKGA